MIGAIKSRMANNEAGGVGGKRKNQGVWMSLEASMSERYGTEATKPRDKM